jgi:hypothetical protein
VKAMLRDVNDHGKVYQALAFCCPGCAAGGPDEYEGLHMLPVNATENIGKASWTWDGNLEEPTLSPSILSEGYCRCHSYLKKGVFHFLEDCTHPLAGQQVPMPDLPEWATQIKQED